MDLTAATIAVPWRLEAPALGPLVLDVPQLSDAKRLHAIQRVSHWWWHHRRLPPRAGNYIASVADARQRINQLRNDAATGACLSRGVWLQGNLVGLLEIITFPRDPMAVLGFLWSPYAGYVYLKAAGKFMVDLAFELGYKRVEFTCYERDRLAKRFAAAIGMGFECVKEGLYTHGVLRSGRQVRSAAQMWARALPSDVREVVDAPVADQYL